MKVPERLSKHAPIVGEEGIEKIRRTRLTIVGVSGNGSPAALLAALTGFGQLTLVDPDILEESNRNRFVFGGRTDVGRYKVDIAKEYLDRIDSDIESIALPVDVRSRQGRSAVRRADVVVSGVDENEAREFLQEQCSGLRKPLLDLGSGGLVQDGQVRMLGSRVSLFVPGGACLYHQTLAPDTPALSPVSMAMPNFIAAAVGLELLIGWTTGYGKQINFALYDSLQHSLISMNIAGDPGCPFCAGQVAPQSADFISGSEIAPS